MRTRIIETLMLVATCAVAIRLLGEIAAPSSPPETDAPTCALMSAFPAEPDPPSERDADRLEIAPERLTARCVPPKSVLLAPYMEREQAYAPADDPVLRRGEPCVPPLRVLATAWLDEQVRDVLNPQKHVATRWGGMRWKGTILVVAATWTTEPGELLEEPVDVEVTEGMSGSGIGYLTVQLDVASLRKANPLEAEPILETIVRRGLRTSGIMTWNGVVQPYRMRVTHYRSSNCPPPDAPADERCEPSAPKTDRSMWGTEEVDEIEYVRVEPDDCFVQGMVGERVANTWATARNRLKKSPLVEEQLPWFQTVHVRRRKGIVHINVIRFPSDAAHFAASDHEVWTPLHERQRLGARIERTRRKFGPD